MGGDGFDTMCSRNGRDIFGVELGRGEVAIRDDTHDQDKIRLRNGLTFADLTFAGNTVLTNGDLLAVVLGLDTTTFTQSDFVLI